MLRKALNFQPVKVRTNEARQMTAAMARKYGEERTKRMLPCRSLCPIPLSPAAVSLVAASRDFQLCHIVAISTVQMKRSDAIPRSRLSAPNALATVFEK